MIPNYEILKSSVSQSFSQNARVRKALHRTQVVQIADCLKSRGFTLKDARLRAEDLLCLLLGVALGQRAVDLLQSIPSSADQTLSNGQIHMHKVADLWAQFLASELLLAQVWSEADTEKVRTAYWSARLNALVIAVAKDISQIVGALNELGLYQKDLRLGFECFYEALNLRLSAARTCLSGFLEGSENPV